MVLRLTEPVTEMVPGIFLEVKGGQLAHKRDNLTSIYEPIV
jgi:hypothetical protein